MAGRVDEGELAEAADGRVERQQRRADGLGDEAHLARGDVRAHVVFPWSTCASTAITGVEPALAAVGASGGGSGLTSRVRTPRSSATADAIVAGTMHMASDGVMYVPASSSGKGCFRSR